ncbi:hypothetical protein [Vibrio cincinnatiensis]
MSISAVSSGYPILQQSSKMAEEAALDLQKKRLKRINHPVRSTLIRLKINPIQKNHPPKQTPITLYSN